MKRQEIWTRTIAVVVLLVPALAEADWNVGDPYTMHYPQLPDLRRMPYSVNVSGDANPAGPFYWDVVADDFLSTQTAPISDIHIWGAWNRDQLYASTPFKLSIHANDPGTNKPQNPPLWQAVLLPSSARTYATVDLIIPYDFGPDSYAVPQSRLVQQYNFVNLPEAFVQQAGQTYWLQVQVMSGAVVQFGWMTTNPEDPLTPHFMQHPVYASTDGFNGPLNSDYTEVSEVSDMAFVIAPEPTTLLLLALGGAVLIRPCRPRA